MKRVYHLFLILIIHFGANAQDDLVWVNNDQKIIFKLDINSAELYQAPVGKPYIKIQKLNLSISPDLKNHILGPTKLIVVHGKSYINIDGKILLHFDLKKGFLKQLNFPKEFGESLNPLIFTYRDDLYRLGGEGFWGIHSLLYKFDFSKNTWINISIKGNYEPKGVKNQFASFDSKENKIYIYFSEDAFFNDQLPFNISSIKKEISVLDLNTLEWSYLGETTDLFNSFIPRINYEMQLFSHYGTFLDFKYFYIFDFKENKILRYNGAMKGFFYSKLFLPTYDGKSVNKIFPMGLYSNSSIKPEELIFVKYNWEEILKNSEYLGILYSKDLIDFQSPQFHIFLILFFSLLLIYLIKSNSFKFKAFSYLKSQKIDQSVNPILIQFLKNLLKNAPSNTFDSNQINELLNIDSKAFDTQRQYRSKLIIEFNLFMKSIFKINNAIVRISDNNDKRFVIYQINPEIFDNSLVQSFLKNYDEKNTP